MTKKNVILLGLFIVLAVVWVILFSGWFATRNIQIMHNVHQGQRRRFRNNNSDIPVVIFGFNHPYQLTDVKVIAVSELATNASPLPVWHLVSESNSVPVKSISYGQWIGGMKPAVVNIRAKPLQPGQTYRLFVTAGSREKGEYEFKAPQN